LYHEKIITRFHVFLAGILFAQRPGFYDVERIPYSLYQINASGIYVNDDAFSPIIPIGFQFEFFYVNYDSLVIGSNGLVTFDTGMANNYCRWSIHDTIPSPDIYKNSIFGVYQDIDNSNNNNGAIGFGTVGTAPFRKFVTFYDSIPLFTVNTTCDTVNKNTYQIVLYETYHFIDVQIKRRIACDQWNNGNGLVGIQDTTGSLAFTPPNRNTGSWQAAYEAWRFRPVKFPEYQYVVCSTNQDNITMVPVDTILNHFIANGGQGYSYSLHMTEDDALNNVNPVTSDFQNTSNPQKVYVRAEDSNGQIEIKIVLIAVIDCNADYDIDGVDTVTEDINANGNFGDDDTDGDGIPDFMDDDDDGDMVLTSIEILSFRSGNRNTNFPDTDGDGIPNYLDNDDDGDGILTIDEDADGDGNPANDDTNNDGIPDYLQATTVSTPEIQTISNRLKIYPNPANDFIDLKYNGELYDAEIHLLDIKGNVIIRYHVDLLTELRIKLPEQSGLYLIHVSSPNGVFIKKIIRQ
jgi:hypothetical protein